MIAARVLVAAALAALLAGCGMGIDPGPCGPMPDRAPPCVTGGEGQTCVSASGSGSGLVCVGTAWVCPQGSVPQDRCGCFGTQAGAPCGGGMCAGPVPTFVCLPGAAGRACGDVARSPVCAGAAWGCPNGTARGDTCGCRAGVVDGGTTSLQPGDACPGARDASTDGAIDAASDTASDIASDAASDTASDATRD